MAGRRVPGSSRALGYDSSLVALCSHDMRSHGIGKI
jgi:hypothetical protein